MEPGMDDKIEAIFLDRDGVINRERSDYVKQWNEFEFLPNVLSALQQLATLHIPILVITNQSAIGRGLVSMPVVNTIHRRAQMQIQAAGGRIDGFFICPHRPDENCACRKPKPGLLFQAATAYRLDLWRCVFIGDTLTDLQAARCAGCRAILVESGRQGDQLHSWLTHESSVTIVKDLAAAAALCGAATVGQS
jgi:D-glycero-D-manno-heptose 1,7-bisphosphate phosphatase